MGYLRFCNKYDTINYVINYDIYFNKYKGDYYVLCSVRMAN